VGPAGLPPAIFGRLNKEINGWLQDLEARRHLSNQGAELRVATPEEFGQATATDLKKWAKVVAAAGIKIK
jgi:tripartite-type tricarboxylate transporter receptor subunit TctC